MGWELLPLRFLAPHSSHTENKMQVVMKSVAVHTLSNDYVPATVGSKIRILTALTLPMLREMGITSVPILQVRTPTHTEVTLQKAPGE